ncbi:MAG TPA: radical SAM protein, partial [Pyrinomonadaceae bacterium]|nr:radical SAM protein [Pyrinomonadaceae bacterium]
RLRSELMSKKVIESYKRRLSTEGGWVLKRGASLRVALCYPNVYGVGMANLGFQSVYELSNRIPEVSCERVFLPEESELREYERAGTPLLSLESQTPVRDFDLVAFSVSFETDYYNVARMLRLARVPLWSRERTHHDPLVLMGGAASFLNPEPVADFTDAVAVGEGEILVPRLVDLIFENAEEGGAKEDLLLKLARTGRGFYVPSLYEVTYKEDGTVEAYAPKAEGVPARVGRTLAAENPKEGSLRRAMRRGDTDIVEKLKEPEVFAPSTVIYAPEAEMGERLLVEISRGCSQGCRFCWAGFNYWPPRVVPARDILAKAAEWRAKTDKIGLVSTAVCDHPEISDILQGLRGMGYKISVSSLRLDQIEDELLDVLVESGDQQIAVAPETGSDRLRKVINKNLTNDEIVDICGAVFDRGMLTVKLYLMAGLPTETDEDLEEMVRLVERVKDRMLEAGRRFGRVGKIIPALNGFVPKPNTPFQWEPICEEKELKRRLRWLSKNLARIPNVEVRVMSARVAHEQAIFSSGDRRVSAVIEAMARAGGDLQAALRETGADADFHTRRARPYEEFLPWEIVDAGISRAFLEQEHARARAVRSTAPCPSVDTCTRCGVCPTTWLAAAPAGLVQLQSKKVAAAA